MLRKNFPKPSVISDLPKEYVQRRAADFWSKVEKTTACWLWKTYVTPAGYAQFSIKGRMWRAHRIAWQLTHGPIPHGMELDHICRIKSCVNPAHLEPVSHRENVLRADGPTAVNAKATHCKRGHALSGENIGGRFADGARRCQTCIRENRVNRRSNYERRQRELLDENTDIYLNLK